jgi:hypothetical protein
MLGVAEGKGVGCEADLGPFCPADVGAGDWAARLAPSTQMKNIKNRDIRLLL